MPKDLFSSHAQAYATHRPLYPPELYQFILQHVQERSRVWDCATGNGQAAYALATFFNHVDATDISAKQLAEASNHPNIHYSVAPAEKTNFDDAVFDLVTVAQAYHWFNFELFHAEASRVLKPTGIVALWGYGLIKCENEHVTEIISRFYNDTIGQYWDPERKYIEDHYQSVPFPFDKIATPEFKIKIEYTLEQLLKYLETWSAVQKYIQATNLNPIDELRLMLAEYWQEPNSLRFEFPLFLLLGRVR